MRIIAIIITLLLTGGIYAQDSAETLTFGAWRTHTFTDRMTDQVSHNIFTVGTRLSGSRHNSTPQLLQGCHKGKKSGGGISLAYLNPDDTERAPGGSQYFEITIRFDKMPARKHRVWKGRSGNGLYFGDISVNGGPGAEAIRRHMRNSETMLVQVSQYQGTDTFEFDVSDFAEAEAWVDERCEGSN